MNNYDEIYPSQISYEKYETDIVEKELKIDNLQNLLKQRDEEIEDSKIIIKKLMEELKEYERNNK